MSDWITDRSPTEADADSQGLVWESRNNDSFLAFWNRVGNSPWMPTGRPKPYQPPKPETSLAASIERAERRLVRKCPEKDCACKYCDRDRIIEAARRWDEWEPYIDNATKRHDKHYWDQARVADSAVQEKQQSDNDPDGVGDGWRPCFVVADWLEYRFVDGVWYSRRIDADSTDTGESEHGRKYAKRTGKSDPSQEWVEELIRLCEQLDDETPFTILEIKKHLRKRGE